MFTKPFTELLGTRKDRLGILLTEKNKKPSLFLSHKPSELGELRASRKLCPKPGILWWHEKKMQFRAGSVSAGLGKGGLESGWRVSGCAC